MENQNLIVIEQLPIIKEQLKKVAKDLEKKVEDAKNLVCTEENVKVIKQVRADLNKEFKEFEIKRKAVKEQILAPYMRFEEAYKTYISEKYGMADKELKQKVDSIENKLRDEKEQEIKDYFEEYKVANKIDFVKYEQLGINVTLTASKKSLKEQVKKFIDEKVDDLKLIETQDCKEEILVEYKQNLNVSRAIQEVANRHKLLEEERRKQEEKKITIMANENHEITKESYEQQVFNEPLKRPEEQKQEQLFTLKFTVRAPKTKLKELKEFLIKGGYDYE